MKLLRSSAYFNIKGTIGDPHYKNRELEKDRIFFFFRVEEEEGAYRSF
jgi:hypothetical protein